MGAYLASRIIAGKLIYAEVIETKFGKKYKADIDKTLDERGYYIDDSGACVRKPAETSTDDRGATDSTKTGTETDSGTDTTENTGK